MRVGWEAGEARGERERQEAVVTHRQTEHSHAKCTAGTRTRYPLHISTVHGYVTDTYQLYFAIRKNTGHAANKCYKGTFWPQNNVHVSMLNESEPVRNKSAKLEVGSERN